MATAFKNYTTQSIGTTAYYLISQNSGAFNGGVSGLTSVKAVIMVGCMVSNRLTTSITIDVAHYQNAGSKTTYLCKTLSIPAGDAIEIVQGKIILVGSDDISVVSDTASSADVVLSILFDA